MTGAEGITYRQAGVDVEAGERAAEGYKALAAATHTPEVLGAVGLFAGLFRLPPARRPVLVAGCDGVGTKLKVARAVGRLETVGIDLVAMSANDVLVHGARPLFFLDYLATGRLVPEEAVRVVAGVAEGCRQAGCALLGGETAEMPGMYAPGDFDLAGFCVGLVEEDRVVDGRGVRPGDAILGLASSGLHSNGYSLARRILERSGVGYGDPFPSGGRTWGEVLLTPTRIYVRPVLRLLEALPVHALCHVTGGGIARNLIRVLPEGVRAVLERRRWSEPEVFRALQRLGAVPEEEMDLAFNRGLGFLVVVPAESAEKAAALLAQEGEEVFCVGRVEAGARRVEIR